jgi:hypothetical protein
MVVAISLLGKTPSAAAPFASAARRRRYFPRHVERRSANDRRALSGSQVVANSE